MSVITKPLSENYIRIRISTQDKKRVALKAYSKGKSMSEYLRDIVITNIEDEENLGYNDPYLQKKLKLFSDLRKSYPDLSTDRWRLIHEDITGLSIRLKPLEIWRSLIYHLINRIRLTPKDE